MTTIKKRRKKRSKKTNPTLVGRIYVLFLVILFLGVSVFIKLYSVQVLASEEYKKTAQKQYKSSRKIMPRRGNVYIQEKGNEFPLAVNQELMTVYAIPDQIEDPEKMAFKVAEILKLDKEELLKKLSKKRDLYEVIKRRLSQEEVEKIKSIEERGVYLEPEQWRYYPNGQLAAQTVGFVGYLKDGQLGGRYGIENWFEEELGGELGFLNQDKDTFGRWISVGSKSKIPAKDGQDLVLTIDHILQVKAELVLANAVKKHGADSGQIVIVEPTTGKILTMAAVPTFNPNEYSKTEDISTFINPIVSHAYESGSVFKPVTMAMGLDMEKINPQTTYFDHGVIHEAGFEIKNSDEKAYQNQTMTEVIEKSLNTGVIYVEKLVGNQKFAQYVERFGFGQKTGVDLPGEAAGNISNLKNNRDIEYFTASFGQGIAVTPLQLVMAYAAFANEGELLTPQVVDYKINSNREKEFLTKKSKQSVISKKAAGQISQMLKSNVKNGHGKLAGVPGYAIAGKTGTAQIPDKEKGGYLEDATIGTFAGFGPVENPIFAMVVIIENPKDVEWAESTAAPVFGQMAKFMLDYFDVEPSLNYTVEEMDDFVKKHNYLNTEPEIENETEEDEEKEEEN